jgi:hypothetical protein
MTTVDFLFGKDRLMLAESMIVDVVSDAYSIAEKYLKRTG